MKKFIITLCLGLVVSSKGQTWYPKWEQSGVTWQEKWNNTLNALENYQKTEQIDILGAAVRLAPSRHNPAKEEVFRRAQNLLLKIPGHADYYANEIKKSKEAALSPEELQDRNGKISWAKYNQVRGEAFDTLEHLPSVETVKVLGSFLHDIEDPNDMTTHTGTCLTYGPGSNSGLTTIALKTLIDDAPIKTEDGVVALGEIEIWQKWFEQVKAGNRTFRFMGNSTAYDLNGPAPEEKLARIERDRKRDEERLTGNRKSRLGSESASVILQLRKPSTIAGILAACALVAGAVWYFLRVKRLV